MDESIRIEENDEKSKKTTSKKLLITCISETVGVPVTFKRDVEIFSKQTRKMRETGKAAVLRILENAAAGLPV